ncbi:MAG: universal stress protein [Nitrospirae bacterium]|nr:universal stress protein [Nitrospirota bacterium]
MKILVPLDGSGNSIKALYNAIDYVKTKGGELYLLTITQLFETIDLEISAAQRDSLKKSMEQRSESVVNKACDIASAEGIKARCKAIISSISVPDAIIDFAEKEKIDLIIISSRGLSPSSRFKLGSVTGRVVKHSPCSVYVVK